MDPIDLGQYLHAAGHRLTTPRRLVWEVLENAAGHLTAEQVAEQVRRRDERVNLASVYRSLALFAAIGLARESNLGPEGPARWEPAHPDDEFHLICDSCGEVRHHGGSLVDDVRAHLASDHGFTASTIDLSVRGICGRCRAAGVMPEEPDTRH